MNDERDSRSLWSRTRRWLARFGVRLSTGAAVAAVASAQAQQTVPEHWISYATVTGQHLQSRLSEGGGELVTRLHQWLESRAAAGAQSVAVVVKIWIAPSGEISRSEFASLGDVQADADLRAILGTQPVPQTPPPDMLQPLVLRLTLRANPDYQPPVD